jgi:ubiquinone/menaquinone biosynthesis C-methylase UbiE
MPETLPRYNGVLGSKYRLPTHPVISAYVWPKLDFMRKTVLLDERTSVLDVGCGNGIYTYYLAEICHQVTGVDSSRNMLSVNPCSTVVQSDASELPLQKASFDVVFEANLLHHVSDRAKVVEEMARV